MKYFVISDVHSFFDEMLTALNDKGFQIDNPDHVIISCGDLLDRGDKSLEVLKFVNDLPPNRKILIKGNHEDLLEECLKRREFYQHDLQNGTVKTVMNLCGKTEDDVFFEDYHHYFDNAKKNKDLSKYLLSLVDYAEIGNYVCVHGWIPCKRDDVNIYHVRNVHYTFDPHWEKGDWKKARWINGMDAWRQGVVLKGKTIICGHFHASWGHYNLHHNGNEFDESAHFEPFIDEGICAIDACTAYSHKVNCYVFES